MLKEATDVKKLINYPNPIFAREKTVLIDGDWAFSLDGKTYRPINVPFCPQSKLSGIEHTDFIRECFYKTSFNCSGLC